MRRHYREMLPLSVTVLSFSMFAITDEIWPIVFLIPFLIGFMACYILTPNNPKNKRDDREYII